MTPDEEKITDLLAYGDIKGCNLSERELVEVDDKLQEAFWYCWNPQAKRAVSGKLRNKVLYFYVKKRYPRVLMRLMKGNSVKAVEDCVIKHIPLAAMHSENEMMAKQECKQ